MLRSTQILTVLVLAAAAPLSAQRGATMYHVTDSILVGKAGGDFYALDPVHRQLYGAGSYVVDIDKKTVAHRLADTTAGGGFALAPELGRGAARNGTVFDLTSGATIAQLGASGDGYAYDPATKRAFFFTDSASVVDVAGGTLVGKMILDPDPESGVSDGQGTLYVNFSDKGTIGVVDARAMTVKTTYTVPDCKSPHALQMDRSTQRLFVTCVDKHILIVNAKTGAIVTNIAVPGFSDQSAFDPGTRLLFAPNGGQNGLTILHEDGPDKYTIVQTLVDPRVTSNKVAVDEKTHRVYLPHRSADGNFSFVVLDR
jgi:hypothetical protein